MLSEGTDFRGGVNTKSAGRLLPTERFIALASLGAVLVYAPASRAQSFVSESTASATRAVSPSYRIVDGLTGNDVVVKMMESNRLRDERLQRYSAVRTYEIQNPDGRMAAEAVVRVDYRAPGIKTFQKVSEEGSWPVRRLVFDRLLQSEEETSTGQEHHDSSISPANYDFALTGQETLGDRRCYVVEVKPKRMEKYLFEGTLWVDAQDFAIAQISGHPAKKPSFWIKRADFVRKYQRIDGFWLPLQDETVVDVKVHGTRVFRIEHQQYEINAAENIPTAASGAGGSN